ncbi:sigma-70 family RNA polymerase sigma factor [Roseinatronobacter sp.]|uniref:sigma-70 family RNA polymerase sigma factor n=1 Tax=Roseinatronobacter sp. TaxID=1945755 RepID=UPI0025D79EBE|nr:sigma-70 family RNA polymerase sigma factor [Roseibaca sp.]
MDNERDIIMKAQRGDRKAVEALVESVRPFVFSQASQYRSKAPFEDLVSAGFLGAVEAIEKADSEKGTFMNIAFYYVRNRIREQVYLSASSLTLKAQNIQQKRAFTEIRESEHDDDLSPRAVALKTAMMGSLDVHDVDVGFEDEFENIGSSETLSDALDTLSERERFVVECCFLNDETHEQVAEKMGVSRQRVQQIKERSLLKMKKELEKRGLSLEDLL